MLRSLIALLKGPEKVDAVADVEIYTWKTCPYCWRAKRLLAKKGSSFVEHAIDGDDMAQVAMAERAGGVRTVPQIFIDGHHVGGCDDLHALEKSGELDSLLTRMSQQVVKR